MDKNFIVVGCAAGDEAKGATVDFLTQKFNSTLTCRFNGGSNAAHNVVTENNLHHTFANFGSGTLRGAKTLYLPKVLVNPHSIVAEWEVLKSKGFDTLKDLYIHEDCMIVTPLHVKSNRRKSRNDETCGMGIGETMRAAEGGFKIQVKDIQNFVRYKNKVLDINDFLSPFALRESFNSEELYEFYKAFFNLVNIVNTEQAAKLINENVTVFEGSQGILLDEYFGFNPYTTWSTTTSQNADEFLKEIGCKKEVERIGCFRSYSTRHGLGPMPSETDLVNYPELHNKSDGEFQGKFKQGFFDGVLAQYAIDVQESIGAPFNGFSLSHLDFLDEADRLKGVNVVSYYILQGMEIRKILPIRDSGDVRGKLLAQCVPILTESTLTKDKFWRFPTMYGKKILIRAFGPKTNDRKWYEN